MGGRRLCTCETKSPLISILQLRIGFSFLLLPFHLFYRTHITPYGFRIELRDILNFLKKTICWYSSNMCANVKKNLSQHKMLDLHIQSLKQISPERSRLKSNGISRVLCIFFISRVLCMKIMRYLDSCA